MLNITYQ